MSYVEIQEKIVPKNGNSFMLMDAEYIDYDGNGTTNIKVKVDNIINEVSGSTNYVSTISNLITALTSSKDVFLADTTFLLTSHLTSISSSINVVGKEGTIIDGSSVYRIKPDNLANVTFKNITFQNFLGFESYNCKNLKFINCKFINTQSNAISFNTSVGGIYLVKDCYFENIGIAVASDDDAKGMGLGVTINGPGELTVEGCEFYKIHGHAGIMVREDVTRILIERNKCHDTSYGFVKFINMATYITEVDGKISGNNCWNIGTENTFGIGVGASVIYSGTSGTIPGVNVFENTIKNVTENGIEGMFNTIGDNYIESTGIDTTKWNTPSIEGIYCPLAYVVEHNHIKNPKGNGILASLDASFATTAISNLRILNNIIESDSTNTHNGIELNAPGGYTDVLVKGNTIKNFSADIYHKTDYPSTNVVIDYGISKTFYITATSATLSPNSINLCDTTSNAITLTLPTAIAQANPITINLKTLSGSNYVTVKTASGTTLATLSTQGQSIKLTSYNESWCSI